MITLVVRLSQVAIFSALAWTMTVAQIDWTLTTGPYGGAFRSIDIRGNLILVGGDNGVTFLSTDTGTTWTRPTRIIASSMGDILSVAISSPGTLHAVNEFEYFRSTNLGMSWQKGNAYAGRPTKRLRYTPGFGLFGIDAFYLRRSTNDGLDWDGMLGGITFLLDVEITDSGALYVGSESRLYYSSDVGVTWTNPWADGIEGRDIEFAPDGRIFVANWTGYYHTSDHGMTWFWDSLSPGHVRSFYNPGDGDFYGCSQSGLYRSRDSGKLWEQLGPRYEVHMVRKLPSGEFLAAGAHAVYRFFPGDTVWSVVPLTSVITGGLCKDSAGVVYAATHDGVKYSTDRGETWILLDSTLYHQTTSIVADKDNHIIFASLGAGSMDLPVSHDSPFQYTFMATRPEDFAVGPDNTIYAAMFLGSVQGVLESRNGGKSWRSIGLTGHYMYAVLAYESTVVASGSGGTYFKIGNASEWELRDSGFVTHGVNTLIRDAGGRLYAGTYEGIYFSDNEGLFWQRDTNELFGKTIGELSLNGLGEGFAATTGGVYLSRDRGRTWIDCGLSGRQTYSIVCLSNDTILASTFDRAIYRGVIQRDPVSVEENRPGKVIEYQLDQNYPNPFNPTTTISFSLANDQDVKLSVFDVQGRLMERLIDRRMQRGVHRIQLDGSGWPTGMYFYKLQTNDVTSQKKMVLIK